jgi:hypothetical protein
MSLIDFSKLKNGGAQRAIYSSSPFIISSYLSETGYRVAVRRRREMSTIKPDMIRYYYGSSAQHRQKAECPTLCLIL